MKCAMKRACSLDDSPEKLRISDSMFINASQRMIATPAGPGKRQSLDGILARTGGHL